MHKFPPAPFGASRGRVPSIPFTPATQQQTAYSSPFPQTTATTQQSTPSTFANQSHISQTIGENQYYNPYGFDPTILAYFAPRPPLEFIPPKNDFIEKRKRRENRCLYSPVSSYVEHFSEYDTEKVKRDDWYPPQLLLKKKKEDKAQRDAHHKQDLMKQLKTWKEERKKSAEGVENEKETKQPFNTLFVSRLGFDIDEKRLEDEFTKYGPINRVRIVRDVSSGKSRGYGFIEFERREDMQAAYQYSAGKIIEGREVVVDVERGRTVSSWRPRRLGGGLGDSRAPRKKGEVAALAKLKRQEENRFRQRKRRRFDDGPRGRFRGGRGRGRW